MNKLKTLRCPQNWGFKDFVDIEEALLLKEKSWFEGEDEDDMSNTKYAWQVGCFSTFCLLSYEAYRKKEYNKALNYLARADVSDDFMKKYNKVFQHVMEASKAHILYAMNLLEDAEKIAVELNKEQFSEAETAAFMYVQCSFQMKYSDSVSGAVNVELIESALKVVKDEAEFHYLHGLLLGRIRHKTYPFPPPSSKEIEALRFAMSLRKDMPLYAITCARLYMDLRRNVPYKKSKEFLATAESIYRNLLKYHESLSGNDIARCVYNITRIKLDSDLEEYAKLAQKKSGSTLVNHYIGYFYLLMKQYEEAYACYDNASNTLPYLIGCVLLLMYRMNGDSISDTMIEPRIQQWTSSYVSSRNKENLIVVFLNISQFYLIVLDNLKSASLYFLLAATYDTISKPCFISISKRCTLNNYLMVLKNQLLSYRQDDETILKAKDLMKTLPKNAVTETNAKIQTPSLIDIRNTLL